MIFGVIFLQTVARGGGGGGMVPYFHTYVGAGYFFGFKILKFIFSGFRKMKFLGYEDFVDIFGGSSQNLTIFRGHFYAFWGFFKFKVQNGGIFGGC